MSLTDRAVVLSLLYVAAIAALVALLWALQRSMIYFPDRTLPERPASPAGPIETVTIPTADGLDLDGWFVPAAPAPSTRPVTVLVFNGNAGHRAYRLPLAEALRQRGYSVLLFDYRGFGGNPGTPTEAGLAADARAARAYLASRPDVDVRRLVYFGESLGAAVAVRLASEEPPAALVLRSPFTSLADIGAHHYPFLPVRWLLRDRFPSVDRVGRIGAPLLVIAGDRDSIVPLEHSRRLYESATARKEWVLVRGAGHNDYELLAGEIVIDAIGRFLSEMVVR